MDGRVAYDIGRVACDIWLGKNFIPIIHVHFSSQNCTSSTMEMSQYNFF